MHFLSLKNTYLKSQRDEIYQNIFHLPDPTTRSITNILLLLIALGVDVLIHQNINIRNNVVPMYYI